MAEPPPYAIGVDVGGSKLAAGLVDRDGAVTGRLQRDTPDDPDAIVAAILAVVAALERQAGVQGLPVGVGLAAIIDPNGVARYAPNLPFVDVPLGTLLSEGLGRPVSLDNDANAAAWGEYRVGAGARARHSLVLLTVGTGVGGGLVLEGRLQHGSRGFAAEFGHVIVDEGGPLCACGNRGCLEALASGTAIRRTARAALAADEALSRDSVLRAEPAVTGKAVALAAQAGDAFARSVLGRCGFWLGVGAASLVNALDPEIVVVGGGAAQAGELLLAPARAALAERLLGRGHRPCPPLVASTLGDDGGLVGAALLALDSARDAWGLPGTRRKTS